MPPRTFATVDKILEYTGRGKCAPGSCRSDKIPFSKESAHSLRQSFPWCRTPSFKRSLRIVECIHHLLCVLRSLSIQSEDIQSPQMLHQIAQVAVTLQKVDSCLRAQQELEQSGDCSSKANSSDNWMLVKRS
ncbi:hypothetical protein B0H14DRAFT_2622647 [Mycena olivaceomarginata]|nr:hypothetical protein B0H14DRAFT_2622647 [Mycena olivaceomarginata]